MMPSSETPVGIKGVRIKGVGGKDHRKQGSSEARVVGNKGCRKQGCNIKGVGGKGRRRQGSSEARVVGGKGRRKQGSLEGSSKARVVGSKVEFLLAPLQKEEWRSQAVPRGGGNS